MSYTFVALAALTEYRLPESDDTFECPVPDGTETGDVTIVAAMAGPTGFPTLLNFGGAGLDGWVNGPWIRVQEWFWFDDVPASITMMPDPGFSPSLGPGPIVMIALTYRDVLPPWSSGLYVFPKGQRVGRMDVDEGGGGAGGLVLYVLAAYNPDAPGAFDYDDAVTLRESVDLDVRDTYWQLAVCDEDRSDRLLPARSFAFAGAETAEAAALAIHRAAAPGGFGWGIGLGGL